MTKSMDFTNFVDVIETSKMYSTIENVVINYNTWDHLRFRPLSHGKAKLLFSLGGNMADELAKISSPFPGMKKIRNSNRLLIFREISILHKNSLKNWKTTKKIFIM